MTSHSPRLAVERNGAWKVAEAFFAAWLADTIG
jgi:hypothetical protein